MKSKSRAYLYGILSVFCPILYIYLSPISGVDLGTFMVVLLSFLFVSNKGMFRMPKTVWLVLLYTFFITFLTLFSGRTLYSSAQSVFFRAARFIIVLVLMIGLGYPSCFDKAVFIKILRYTSLFVAVYAIAQFVAYRFLGFQLINVFGPIKGSPVNTYFADYTYRPPSVFLEPSHVAYFLSPYLCYVLFCNVEKSGKTGMLDVAIISLGIIATTSGQGLLVLAVCWFIWLLYNIKKLKFKTLILAVIFITVIFVTYDFSFTLDRIFRTDEYNAIEARSIGYTLISDMSPLDKAIGMGFGNYDDSVYYSSFAEIIFCTGYIGLALVLLLYFVAFIRGSVFQRTLVVVSLLLMVGGGIYTASSLCLYLPILITKGWGKTNE